MFSWEYDILPTLLRHKKGPLQDTIKIVLGSTMLLALRRSLGHQLLGIQLRPMRLNAGKGHMGTFNTDRPLHGFDPRTGTHKPLHKSEVAARYRIGRPQPDYQILNSFSVDIPSSAL